MSPGACRSVEAFEHHDMDGPVSLLREDTMPSILLQVVGATIAAPWSPRGEWVRVRL